MSSRSRESRSSSPGMATGSTTAFTAKADVRDSTFSRNGSDGIDIDLRGPDDLADDVAPGGHFEVRIENVLCAENGSIGCLVDLDYEALDLWSSELVLERVEARANGTDGIRLDLDDGVGPNDATPTVNNASAVTAPTHCAGVENDAAAYEAVMTKQAVRPRWTLTSPSAMTLRSDGSLMTPPGPTTGGPRAGRR